MSCGEESSHRQTAYSEGRCSTKGDPVLADSYPFMNIMWTMLVFFAWVIWIYLLVMVLGDNFRRRDHNGWAKAAWTLFVIFLPLLGALVYMIARPSEDTALYA